MKSYEVTEGYGVCGPAAELEITTTTLLSCSAVILLNKTQRILGLFHYPALALGAPGIQNAMIQMINDIVPGEITLWTANPQVLMGNADLEKKIVRLDNAKVKTFLELRKPSACTVTLVTGVTFGGVSSDGTSLEFRGGVTGNIKVPGSTTITSAETRKQSGNIWFYHGSSGQAGDYGRKVEDAAMRILEIERG